MKRLAVGASAIFAAALALGYGLPPTASALPEQHIALGELYPFAGEGVAKGENATTLSTALSSPISSEEVKFLFSCASLGSSCSYDAHFINEKVSGKTCHTEGDAEGVDLAKGEGHFVWLSLEPLTLGLALLVFKLTKVCSKGEEALKVTVEGVLLAKIEGVTSGVTTTSFKANIKCTKPGNGKQAVKEYFNDESKLVVGILKANLGLGTESACLEVKEPITVTTNKMVNVLF